MSEQQLKTLARIIRDGWKAIANEDADDFKDLAKAILESLEQFESAAEVK